MSSDLERSLSAAAMESCNGVDRELTNVCDKFNLFSSVSAANLCQAATAVRAARHELQEMLAESAAPSLNPTQTLMLVKALQTVKEAAAKLGSDHRELHTSVSKVGKVIDRNFVTDYDSTSRPDVFSTPQQHRMLNQVILQHFYRAGQLEIGETLAAEAGIADEDGDGKRAGKEPFMEMNRILDSLKNRDLRKLYM